MLDTRQANAIKKAIELNGAAQVKRIEYGTYTVPSASEPGVLCVVTGQRVDGADLECDCPAGSWGRPCWHKASVMIAKMQHAAGVRVIGPAPVPAATVTVTRHAGLKRVALV